jgi:hypothetical protein
VGKRATHDVNRGIAGSVVDDDDLEIALGRSQQRLHRFADHLLFVKGGNERCDRSWRPRQVQPLPLPARMHQRKTSNPQKPHGPEHNPCVEEQRQEGIHVLEKGKARIVRGGNPSVFGSNPRHHFVAGQAQKLMHWQETEACCP